MLSFKDISWFDRNYMHPLEYKGLAKYGLRLKKMFGVDK